VFDGGGAVLKAVALSMATLLAIGGALGVSEMGGPAWLLALLLAFLLTLGLPTTLTTMMLAALWGRLPWLTGLRGFVIAAAALGIAAHCAALRALAARRRSSG